MTTIPPAFAKPLPSRPYRAKPRDIEGPIHRSILDYLRLTLPKAVIHHSANEIGLSGKAIERVIAKAKWNGMLVGFPDIIVITAGSPAIGFEVKAPGGYPSDAQKAVGAALQAAGAHWAVVRSTDDVRECLREWGVRG